MTTIAKKPVLIIGGSGIVGSQAARTLRRLHPDLPIAIGGRDLAKAETVARRSATPGPSPSTSAAMTSDCRPARLLARSSRS